ncbi:Chromosomal replication initiator protein DnaA [Corynebacterium kalinowskii]|uniref:Chromosomal replication initiator protein DnaA n=1 Tax=Corynebacterium kalinowskii TaxID=2675216 RepID=A0A6B8VPF2_9CORY|nr:chromosomal replication initiator protein DnaA [Corynebacterium kalinowskii]QGU00905.1 Chromosomal replication initiator protein DnaA [Corynebacterium kalinowskii]
MTHISEDLQSTWQEIVADLGQLAEDPTSGVAQLTAKQRGFLKLVKPITFVPGYAVISTPHNMARDVIQNDLGDAICLVLQRKMGQPFSLAVSVEPENPSQPELPLSTMPSTPTMPSREELDQLQQSHDHREQWEEVVVDTPPAPEPQRLRRDVPATDKREMSLNPKYTFENFVIGSSNRFPVAAAVAVSESLAQAYNPLFIWGGSGLGKTHLLHAIGNYAKVLQPGLRVRYVSSEEFTNDYINSVRDDRQEKFKRNYRNLDVLMVDDIQFLEGKEGTQEEFFHTFNALHQADKQIVLSSDRPPKELTTLTDRLRTRFKAGLITDIQPPDLETRMAILSKKAQSEGTVVDHEVLELIASRFETSIRELEGALIRVTAYSSLIKEPIDLKMAEIALRDIMPDANDLEISADHIIEQAATYFDISVDTLTGVGKTRAVAHARQIAMYLCRELTDLSLPRIGEHFGGKDHTTVMYAVKKINKEIAEKRDTYDQIQALTLNIKKRK